MRLIDADLLTKKVTEWLNADPNADRMANIDDIAVSVLMEIEEQPTAYDVDKVLMCLDGRAEDCREKGRMLEEAGMEDASRKMYAKAYSYEEAIKIVKRGGIEKKDKDIMDANEQSVEKNIVYTDFMKRSKN